MNKVKADIIIISYNNSAFTLNCIESIKQTLSNVDYEIILVDNNSSDDTLERVSGIHPEVKIIANTENCGYSKAVNLGARAAEGNVLLLCNNDIIFQNGTAEGLIKHISSDDECGVAGCQQVYPDGSWQYSYGDFPGLKLSLKNLFGITFFEHFISKFRFNHFQIPEKVKSVPYLDGACLAVRRDVFEKLNGFDEDFYFYSEESDFCFRVKKAGYSDDFLPWLRLTHFRGAASEGKVFSPDNAQMLVKSKMLFCKKHYGSLTVAGFRTLEIFSLTIKNIFLSVIMNLFGKEKLTNKKSFISNTLYFMKSGAVKKS